MNEVAELIPIEQEERIDEEGINAFQAMGYASLSDNMVLIYKEFKRRKDRLHPGRLTPEGYAFIAFLSEMMDGNLKFDKSPTNSSEG